MAVIPERLLDLLSDEKKAFAALALTLADGSPQVTPIWFGWDGTHLILNTARGRVKDRVMKRGGQVALLIVDPADPYRYMQIRGRVIDETEVGGYDTICDLQLEVSWQSRLPQGSRPGARDVQGAAGDGLSSRVMSDRNSNAPVTLWRGRCHCRGLTTGCSESIPAGCPTT